jgi:tRNA dimethylallyltransferase
VSARVIAIFGPTASGKSAVAEALLEWIPAEIVSADSMQVYAGLRILTNQSPHPAHLVGIWPLEHEASVGEYSRLAHAAVHGILAAGRTPVVVGGTGLYLRAALTDLRLPPAPPPGARERWQRVYDEEGRVAAHARLAAVDPAAAAAIHANDRRRVVRALELAEAGASLAPSTDRLWGGSTRLPTLVFGLEVPPDVLAQRIEARTHAMFEAGVEGEVRRALATPVSSTAAKVIGLDEVAGLPRDEAIAAITARTRRYAAYQRKWMRRLHDLVPLDGTAPPESLAEKISERARAAPATTPRST